MQSRDDGASVVFGRRAGVFEAYAMAHAGWPTVTLRIVPQGDGGPGT